jgi:hypothetical protein
MSDKRNILDLIGKLDAKQQEAMAERFVAPCLRYGRIAIPIAGIACRFTPSDREFEGWGLFSVSEGSTRAKLEGEATKRQVSEYLSRLPRCRFRLCFQGLDSSWAAIPRNKGVFERLFGKFSPVAIRLVQSGTRYDAVVARFDGASWWFDSRDRSDAPAVRSAMCSAYDSGKMPKVAGAAPEDAAAFELACCPVPVKGIYSPPTDEDRIRKMLERGGGRLLSFTDMGDFWNVSWMTGSGRRLMSSILKQDMTVISAGMCLSGRDRDFDLLTLVNVVEQRDDGM